MLLNIRGLRHETEFSTTDIEMSGIEFQAHNKTTWGTGYKRKGIGGSTSITTAGATTLTTEGTMGIIEEEPRE